MSRKKLIDEMDLRILNVLQKEGAITNIDLAKKVQLSPPPTLKRVNDLINHGFISGFIAFVDFRKFGYKFTSAVEYVILQDFEPDFVDRVLRFSKNLITFYEVHRDVGFEKKYSHLVAIYMHKNKEHFLARMKDFIAPIPYNVEFRVYEVLKFIKKLPTIELSLDDVVT